VSEHLHDNHIYYLLPQDSAYIYQYIYVSFALHATAAKSPFTLVFMSPGMRLSFLQNVIRHYFSIWPESTTAVYDFHVQIIK
jgi:hypothetical protein